MEPYLSRISLRPLLVALGFFLIMSGVLTLLNPRALAIGHQRYSWWRTMVVPTEYVSKEGSVVYGIATTALGLVSIVGAYLGDLRIRRRDRSIAQAIVTVAPELERRYGRIEDSTLPQVEATARELRVAPALEPYLLAAFLGRDEFRALEAQRPRDDWSEVEQRISRILIELPHEDLLGTHFHESWREPES
jgi:hypothetical protein